MLGTRLKGSLSAPAATTAWTLDNVSIPSYGKFRVATEETSPSDLFFKDDGTKMYIIGTAGDDVNEYTLSSAWDISTASYVQNFSVATEETTPSGLFFKDDGTKMYVIGSDGDEVNEYSLSSAWDISTASYVQNFSVATEETAPQGVFFKSDGTKMYVVGSFGDEVNEYSLSSAWDISTASYVQNFSVATEEVSPTGLFFKDDGTKMYIIGTAGQDINEYTLSTAWDISTASYVQNFSVANEDTTPLGLFFKSDGTKMYIIGTNTDAVYEYTLSSAWDISTASWDVPANSYFSVATEEINPTAVFFKPDGTKMYVIGTTGDDVNEYTLSSAWNISTASYVQNFSVSAQETNPQSIFFKSDGTKMYIIGFTGDDVNEYTLSSAWDISTASYAQNFSVATEETNPLGIFFKSDGTKMYVTGSIGDAVWSYTLSSAWDISTASIPSYGRFNVNTQDTSPQDIFFKSDGTKMYVLGDAGDDVNEYTLSSAWDVSTASYVQNFSVNAQETGPQGFFFKDDGTKMYVIGTAGDDVNEYTLSSAWDISTASYVQNFSVATEEANPRGVFFKPDGTKMYVIGNSGQDVNEYTLSSAWNVSTASYVQNFSVATEDVIPQGVFFKSDGTKMYVIGAAGDAVYEYTLSSAWDVSTASYVQNFSVNAQETGPTGLFFKSDGTKMYVIGATSDAVWSYTLSSAWDISTASWDAPANSYFRVAAEETFPQEVFFKPDGTKMYVIGTAVGTAVNEYTLSSAWDISTASYVQNFSVATEDTFPSGFFFKSDGTKMYVIGSNSDAVWAYSLV